MGSDSKVHVSICLLFVFKFFLFRVAALLLMILFLMLFLLLFWDLLLSPVFFCFFVFFLLADFLTSILWLSLPSASPLYVV